MQLLNENRIVVKLCHPKEQVFPKPRLFAPMNSTDVVAPEIPIVHQAQLEKTYTM